MASPASDTPLKTPDSTGDSGPSSLGSLASSMPTTRKVHDEVAVEVTNVAKRFRIYKDRNQSLKATVVQRKRAEFEEFWAVNDVSFTVNRGETFGVIGQNGSGKSTLLKCIARILRPTEEAFG